MGVGFLSEVQKLGEGGHNKMEGRKKQPKRAAISKIWAFLPEIQNLGVHYKWNLLGKNGKNGRNYY